MDVERDTVSLCIAGATGWTGRALVQGVLDAPGLALGSAVSRSAAGRDLGEALGREALGVQVRGTVREALDGVDVLVDTRRRRPSRRTSSPRSTPASPS